MGLVCDPYLFGRTSRIPNKKVTKKKKTPRRAGLGMGLPGEYSDVRPLFPSCPSWGKLPFGNRLPAVYQNSPMHEIGQMPSDLH
jgi:hypothetical protein